MAQDTGQRFGVHATCEGMCGKGMTQIMEADAGQPRPLKERFHVAIGRVGIDWIFRLHWVRKDSLTDGNRFSSP